MKKILLAVIVLSAISFLGASCYGNTNTTTPTQSPSSTVSVSTNQVTISNFAFNPQSITVSKGTTVTWTNNDSTAHTVTSDSGVFTSSQIAPGGNFQYTFNDAGIYAYHCSIHPSMTGQVTVQ